VPKALSLESCGSAKYKDKPSFLISESALKPSLISLEDDTPPTKRTSLGYPFFTALISHFPRVLIKLI